METTELIDLLSRGEDEAGVCKHCGCKLMP